MGTFTIFKGADNQYWFNLKAGNGEKILHSEGYVQKQSCLDGITSVKLHSPFDKNYERRITRNLEYDFILKSSNGRTIGIGETYSTQQNRDNGIEAVKREAPNASTVDNT